MKKRILFIINPISGGKNKLSFPKLADKYLDKSLFEIDCIFSKYVGHTFKVAKKEIDAGVDVIVAVGGDGTINEVATAVEGSGKVMGIVPGGSGNGLARSLQIPLNDVAALKRINNYKIQTIDGGRLNDKKFFNVAGLGFDAHISLVFAKEHTRGFKSYIKTTLKEISTYKPQHYTIEIDGKTIERNAFMVSIANSTQFGNNAHISPLASVIDGLLDVCIIKPFPLYLFPVLGYRMFFKTAHHSNYVEIIRGKKIRIVREFADAVHIDGEPVQMGNEIDIEVMPLSLPVLI